MSESAFDDVIIFRNTVDWSLVSDRICKKQNEVSKLTDDLRCQVAAGTWHNPAIAG